MRIKIVKGDITEVDVEAIVNAANNRGYMGGGVAGAIRRKGGVEIEREAVEKGPWEIGDAIVTGAGKLKAKYVIHAATMGLDFKTDNEKISRATESAMKRALELGVKSVAFPALGAGVGGVPIKEVAHLMLQEIMKFTDEYDGEVWIVLYTQKDYEDFLQVAMDMGIKGKEEGEVSKG